MNPRSSHHTRYSKAKATKACSKRQANGVEGSLFCLRAPVLVCLLQLLRKVFPSRPALPPLISLECLHACLHACLPVCLSACLPVCLPGPPARTREARTDGGRERGGIGAQFFLCIHSFHSRMDACTDKARAKTRRETKSQTYDHGRCCVMLTKRPRAMYCYALLCSARKRNTAMPYSTAGQHTTP